jgi:23S rRNA pseudouridine1911/1915/1917 synthase
MAARSQDDGPPPRRLRMGAEARGVRLDRALADRLPDASRTAIAAWIAQGRVTVDGRARAAKTRLAGGEEVVVREPPPRPTTVEPEAGPLSILHEDETILVLDKPSGLPVHPGSGRRTGTLAHRLVHHARDLPEVIGSDRPGIVHRLDADTSGVMVVAKTEAAQRALSAEFAARRVKKEYVACVHGVPRATSGTVEAPLGRHPTARTKMTVREDGRAALTRWRVERALPRHAVLRCFPWTGRTHQIRVHLLSIGHPIVGDPVYGRRSAPGEELAPRLLLHAHRLAFRHPAKGETVAFEAPLPDDFSAAVEALSR